MFPPLTPHEMSTVSGYVSISCWVIVMAAPVWENYVLKSGDGLSVPFIVLWLAGDITNLIGGAMAGVLPTMIILAVYYTICDFVLLFQVYWYRALANRRLVDASERSPLLVPVEPAQAQPKPLLPAYLSYPLLIAFVIASGFIAWAFSTHDDISIPEKPPADVELEWRSQVLGYSSAVLYLGSRVPQIAHNFKTRCAGLSLAMFFFSISGNITYVASILLTSTSRKYIIANASWLAGSGLTVFLDLFVLGQFAVYNWQDRNMEPKVFAIEEVDNDA